MFYANIGTKYDTSLIEVMTLSLQSSTIDDELLSSIKEKDFEEMQSAYITDIIQLYWANNVIKDTIVIRKRSKV